MNGDYSIIERPPLRVLLIEDNPGDADLVRWGSRARVLFTRLVSTSPVLVMGRVFFHVDWAATLEAGRERLAEGKTDLILLDLSLPDSRGMDTFRTIRSLAPQLPVVIFTGRDDQELGFQTIHEGGQDFLVKGQATPQLMDKIIRYALERRPRTPCSARKSGTDSSSRRSPTRSAFSPGTRQPFWPSTRQPSISTGIPRRNSCGEASSTSTSPSPSKLPQLGWRRMTGGRRYAPDTAARTGATWMWR